MARLLVRVVLLVTIPIVVLILIPLLPILAPIVYYKRKQKRLNLESPAAQSFHVGIAPLSPSQNTPILHGLRVVELASYIAASNAGRVFADLGAEVVKVEQGVGDLWRYTLLEYEPNRKHSSPFEIQNMGKIGVQADLKSAADRKRFLEFLQDADVFITNVRPGALQAQSLDYESLRKSFPQLIYAQVSAWGVEGPDSSNAGYDIGAFWASTGLTASINQPPYFSIYPPGLGDLATAQSLAAGIGACLIHRLKSGSGCHVSVSLLHNGMWCVAPAITAATSAGPLIPDYSHDPRHIDPLYRHYATADGKCLAILGSNTPAETSDSLQRVFGISNKTAENPVSFAKAIESAIGALPLAKIRQTFASFQNIPYEVLEELPAAISAADDVTVDLCRCYDGPVKDIPDLKRTPRIPYEFSCYDHKPLRRAPFKGEHTSSFYARGWSPRHPDATLLPHGKTQQQPLEAESVLTGIRILEWSEVDCSVSAGCLMLSDLGAKVTKIEPQAGDPWRVKDPKFFAHLNRGKSFVTLPDSIEQARTMLEELLENCDVFVTNQPLSELTKYGASPDVWRQRKSSLVISMLTPYGLEGPEQNRGALGAMFCLGGFGAALSGQHPPPQALCWCLRRFTLRRQLLSRCCIKSERGLGKLLT
eukprot:c19036_g1_i4.p1 GENE.c19036_g1_i4~~c19036_g1_i4.p1  ORF type:complete len:647 (+),score=112.08 c19036_g1_i4:30-1970(+)